MGKLIVSFFFILTMCSEPSRAGIFDKIEDLEVSQKEAHHRKNQILPGKIVVFGSDGKYIDTASAVVMTPKEKQSQSKSVLSCAHLYFFSIEQDPKCIFIFYDADGNQHKVQNVLTRSKKTNIKAKRDIALFQLEHSIPCNPLNEIAESSPKGPLSCIAYGWVLAAGLSLEIRNANDPKLSEPYCYTSTFEETKKTFVQHFIANQVLRIHDKQGYERFFYIARSPAPPQTCIHDSGAAWFSPNDNKGVTFYAITSLSSRVKSSDRRIKTSLRTCQKESSTRWLGNLVQLDAYELAKERAFYNKHTKLSHHREWLYSNIKP